MPGNIAWKRETALGRSFLSHFDYIRWRLLEDVDDGRAALGTAPCQGLGFLDVPHRHRRRRPTEELHQFGDVGTVDCRMRRKRPAQGVGRDLVDPGSFTDIRKSPKNGVVFDGMRAFLP